MAGLYSLKDIQPTLEDPYCIYRSPTSTQYVCSDRFKRCRNFQTLSNIKHHRIDGLSFPAQHSRAHLQLHAGCKTLFRDLLVESIKFPFTERDIVLSFRTCHGAWSHIYSEVISQLLQPIKGLLTSQSRGQFGAFINKPLPYTNLGRDLIGMSGVRS